MKKKELDVEMLRKYWCEQNLSALEVASLMQTSAKTVLRHVRENGLIRNYANETWLRQQHQDLKLDCKEIAKLASCSVDTIYDWMKRYDISISHDAHYGKMTKYSQDNSFFDDIDTEEKAYWLGFIMADGSVDGQSLSISLSRKDKEHLNRLLRSLNSNRSVVDYETTLKETGKTYQMSKVKVSSVRLLQGLTKHGVIANKSLKETFPSIPRHLQRHFIRGVFDGDGCFTAGTRKQRDYRWCSWSIVGSFELLTDIGDVIYGELGIDLATHEKENHLKLIIAGDKTAITIMEWMYRGATIYLPRKYNKFKSWVSSEREYIVRTSGESPESQAEMTWPAQLSE